MIPYVEGPKQKITYNGVDLSTFGLYVSGNKTFDAPERDVDKVEVPGRSGDLIFDNGRFKNVELHYEYCFIASNTSDFDTKFSELKNFLLSDPGYHRLEDTYHPDEYRMAAFLGPIEVSMDASLEIGTFDLVFDCKPQRYLKSGEEWTDLELDGLDTELRYLEPSFGKMTVSNYKFVAVKKNSSDDYYDMENPPSPYVAFNDPDIVALGWTSTTYEKYQDYAGNSLQGFDLYRFLRPNSSTGLWYLETYNASSHLTADQMLSIIDFFQNDGKTMFVNLPENIAIWGFPIVSGPVTMLIKSDVPILGMGVGLINPDTKKYRVVTSQNDLQLAWNIVPTTRTLSYPEIPTGEYYALRIDGGADQTNPTISNVLNSVLSHWWYPISDNQQVYVIVENSAQTAIQTMWHVYSRMALTSEFNNPTYFESSPIIRVSVEYPTSTDPNASLDPYGTCRIYLGDSSFALDWSGRVFSKRVIDLYIDLTSGVAYDENGVDYSSAVSFSGHSAPTLKPGVNTVTILGDNNHITGISVYPRGYKI